MFQANFVDKIEVRILFRITFFPKTVPFMKYAYRLQMTISYACALHAGLLRQEYRHPIVIFNPYPANVENMVSS